MEWREFFSVCARSHYRETERILILRRRREFEPGTCNPNATGRFIEILDGLLLMPEFHIERTVAGKLRFKCYAIANDTVTIEVTSDLNTWEPFLTRQAASTGFMEFEENALERGARFYRITRRK